MCDGMAKGKDCDKQQAEPMSIHHIITAPPPHVLVHVGQVKLTVVATHAVVDIGYRCCCWW